MIIGVNEIVTQAILAVTYLYRNEPLAYNTIQHSKEEWVSLEICLLESLIRLQSDAYR